MVSKAREDLPDPETPVTTVMALCGTSKSMFLRLCTRAPRTTMFSFGERDIVTKPSLLAVRPVGPAREAESFYYSAGGELVPGKAKGLPRMNADERGLNADGWRD